MLNIHFQGNAGKTILKDCAKYVCKNREWDQCPKGATEESMKTELDSLRTELDNIKQLLIGVSSKHLYYITQA